MRLGHEHDLDARIFFIAEHVIALARAAEGNTMGNEKRRIDRPRLNELQKRSHVPMDMCLTHLERQGLSKCRSERNLIDKSAVDSGNGNGAAFSTGIDTKS